VSQCTTREAMGTSRTDTANTLRRRPRLGRLRGRAGQLRRTCVFQRAARVSVNGWAAELVRMVCLVSALWLTRANMANMANRSN